MRQRARRSPGRHSVCHRATSRSWWASGTGRRPAGSTRLPARRRRVSSSETSWWSGCQGRSAARATRKACPNAPSSPSRTTLRRPQSGFASAACGRRGDGPRGRRGTVRGPVGLAHRALRRAHGDWPDEDDTAARVPAPLSVPTPPADAPDAKAWTALPSREFLRAWQTERTPARATVKRYAASFGQLVRVLGFDNVHRITAADVVAFKAARLAGGRTADTVADDVLACGAVCKWGVLNGLLATNPFAGLAPRPNRRGPASRVGYDDDDARRIFVAARGETGWLRWLPWLLCFTGARSGEFAELRRGDIRQDGGVMVLDIRPNEDRAGKNATFQRLLPLHPALIEEGFLSYVESLPAAPGRPLFPDLAVAADGSRTTTATTIHGRWVRSRVGITDPRKARARLAPPHGRRAPEGPRPPGGPRRDNRPVQPAERWRGLRPGVPWDARGGSPGAPSGPLAARRAGRRDILLPPPETCRVRPAGESLCRRQGRPLGHGSPDHAGAAGDSPRPVSDCVGGALRRPCGRLTRRPVSSGGRSARGR